MNNKRIMIYGLGNMFIKYREQLNKLDGIVFYCDRNPAKVKQFDNGILLADLQAHSAEYDEIIITFGEVIKIADAMKQIGASPSKYRLCSHMLQQVTPTIACYYGEENVDAIIEGLLLKIGINPSGIRYIEIGTNDPVNVNNSYHFYQLGAHGLLIDPLLESEYVSSIIRPRDKFCRAAVVSKKVDGEIDFYVDTDISSGISSVQANHYKNFGGGAPKKIKVSALSISDVFEVAGFEPDVLFIDAEGEDESLLRAIRFSTHPVPVICVEVYDVSFERHRKLISYMHKQGYEIYTVTNRNVNSVFVRSDLFF